MLTERQLMTLGLVVVEGSVTPERVAHRLKMRTNDARQTIGALSRRGWLKSNGGLGFTLTQAAKQNQARV